MSNDKRRRCTKESPMPVGAEGWWLHEEACEVSGSQENGWPGGDIVRVRCAVCGHEWSEELPQ